MSTFSSIIEKFREVMANAGLITNDQIISDGELHRIHILGDKAQSKNGWYVLHSDKLACGFYGCWKRGIKKAWYAKSKDDMSKAERSKYAQVANIARELQIQAKSAAHQKAREIWDNSTPANNNHPYLVKKGIKGKFIRVNKRRRLVIPVYDSNDLLQSLQFISESEENNKMFLSDGAIKGNYFLIGPVSETLYICEGYATAITIHEAMNCGVVIAFDSVNLPSVAISIRQKYPDKIIVICADNDQWNPSNPGLTKGREAAEAVRGSFVYPCFEGFDLSTKPTDFNDLMKLAGIAEVKKQILDVIKQSTSVSCKFRRMSDVTPKPIHWLWPNRIARGKVSLIAGNPGLGKSQITASIAAIVTTGGRWPVDKTQSEIGSVVLLSAEDDAEDTIRPRLEAAEADISRIYILDAVIEKGNPGSPQAQRHFNLKSDIARLDEFITHIGDVALVIIDPITAYLGDTDSHKNAEVRSLLAQLGNLAIKHNVAVICISHLNKGGNREALMRVMGSLAFVAAARAAFVVIQDHNDETSRLFLPIKNNNGNDKSGLSFRVVPHQIASGIETSRILWSDKVISITADEAMAAPSDQEERSELDEAKEFLGNLLINGPMSTKEIKKESEGAGYAWRTIQRAKKSLGIIAVKSGMTNGWEWRFPLMDANSSEESHTKCLAHFDNDGALRNSSETNINPTKNDEDSPEVV